MCCTPDQIHLLPSDNPKRTKTHEAALHVHRAKSFQKGAQSDPDEDGASNRSHAGIANH